MAVNSDVQLVKNAQNGEAKNRAIMHLRLTVFLAKQAFPLYQQPSSDIQKNTPLSLVKGSIYPKD